MYNPGMNRVIISENGDGYFNLAMDEFLLERHRAGILDGVTLYFYVNSNAVIIGRNQNAWRECDWESMEREGVQLVRRHTGGGAVYHDGGNLNFSFIADEREYDKDRQNRVLLSALSSLGISAELSGRNDILVGGRKISGCAYALSGTARGMHGTLLVNTDFNKLSGYLRPSKLKLSAKGITSVRSRVLNLAEEFPVTVDGVRSAVVDSFINEYGYCRDRITVRSADDVVRLYESGENPQYDSTIEKLYAKHSSWEWRMGRSPVFDSVIEGKTPSFEFQMLFTVKNGVIRSYEFYTDSLDTGTVDGLGVSLEGVRFTREDIAAALEKGGSAAREIANQILKDGDE